MDAQKPKHFAKTSLAEKFLRPGKLELKELVAKVYN